jgi:hypothetical protein
MSEWGRHAILAAGPILVWEAPMSTLHVDLRDGFRGHSVKITIDGREVYNRSGVTTDLTISRADGFEAQSGDGTVQVHVSVDPGGIAGSTTIDSSENAYLSVSLRGSEVRFDVSAEPFRYM